MYAPWEPGGWRQLAGGDSPCICHPLAPPHVLLPILCFLVLGGLRTGVHWPLFAMSLSVWAPGKGQAWLAPHRM